MTRSPSVLRWRAATDHAATDHAATDSAAEKKGGAQVRTVLVLGGTGFVGRALVKELLADQWQVVVAGRSPDKVRQVFGDAVFPASYTGERIDLPERVEIVDAIVNLAGISLADGRWTPERKRLILASRLAATQAAVALTKRLAGHVRVLVNASAVGYYGTSETATFTEGSESVGRDFLATVCKEWEAQAQRAADFGVRVVTARFGVVLGRAGGALTKMVLPYRFFAGGPLGSGRQWVSWVHIADATALIRLALDDERIAGPVNVTAPTPVRMSELAVAIGRALHRPHAMPTPAFALRAVLGEMATMVLDGQRVLPVTAQSVGYAFSFAAIEDALRDLLR